VSDCLFDLNLTTLFCICILCRFLHGV